MTARLLSMPKYARRIGVKASTVRRWRLEGMPAVTYGGRRVSIDVAQADEWVRRERGHSVAIRRRSSIYVAKSDAGPVKVGFSSDVQRRLVELSDGPFGSVRLLAVFDGDKIHESKIHRQLSDLDLGNEWFRDDARILDIASRVTSAPNLSNSQERILREAAANGGQVTVYGGAVPVAKHLVSTGLLRTPKVWNHTFSLTKAGREWAAAAGPTTSRINGTSSVERLGDDTYAICTCPRDAAADAGGLQ